MFNWIRNIKFGFLNSDTRVVCFYKRIRNSCEIHRKLIKMLVIISFCSFIFVIYIEPKITGNVLYKTVLMILNTVTFVGVFYPLSILKNMKKSDVIETVRELEKEDEINGGIEKNSSL